MTQDELPRIRTYESDVAEAMQKGNVSRADIALAEGSRRQKAPQSSAQTVDIATQAPKTLRLSTDLPEGGASAVPWRRIALWGGGALALAVFGTLLYYGFLWSRGALPTTKDKTPAAQSAAATVLQILPGETRAGLIQKLTDAVENAPNQLGEARALAVQIDGTPITTEQFFTILNARAPASLARALDPSLTVGVHNLQGNQLFLLVPVRSYERAFADMLTWGSAEMLTDLGPLFKIQSGGNALLNPPALKDTIVKNRDARALFDESGKIIFLYSFLDKETLLFATNDETVRALLPKVSRGRLR